LFIILYKYDILYDICLYWLIKKVTSDYYNNKKDSESVVLEELISSDYKEHNIIVHPDNHSLKNIYSDYCKSLFENTSRSSNISTSSSYSYNNDDCEEMILLIPNYETAQSVRHTLEKKDGINVQKTREKWLPCNCGFTLGIFLSSIS
jgi:hypothetical protein